MGNGAMGHVGLLPACYLILSLGSLRRTEDFPTKRSALQAMSGNPLLRFKGDVHESLKVIETK